MKALKPLTAFFILQFLLAFMPVRLSFEETQKKFPRVSEAYERKEDLLLMKCRSKDVSENFSNMFIRVFKSEAALEVWVQDKTGKYILFNQYNVYAMSGSLGPKRKQGDYQVPEGFYYIKDFNPQSNYHLSLGINYPNESDNILSAAPQKGGNIYIHGARVSAGCIAMSDYYIEDIYLEAVKARNQGEEKIPVQIFPFRMTDENMKIAMVQPEYKNDIAFWNNLQEGYNYFEKNHTLPDVSVGADGLYSFTGPTLVQATR